ncbi:DUF6452 family protein [Salinimicrobium xinjiangense]|uniref:DUF6452 family protein n=1 Tax=Salinimicrobium xinjiangense TaxID=438596 RepID=UPI00040C9CC1|nr:DUF6452 family protein [Salinimicrobium xinjiangense]
MRKFQKWLFSGIFIFLSLSCQKDDICPEGTETTPLLIIQFYDPEDPTRLKAVQNLTVRASGMEENYLGPVTTNEISIPLRTDANSTEYIFTYNSGSDQENEDLVSFSYSPNPQYINRACGYKINYTNLDVGIQQDDQNWILSEIILQENVENETEAHISFTH